MTGTCLNSTSDFAEEVWNRQYTRNPSRNSLSGHKLNSVGCWWYIFFSPEIRSLQTFINNQYLITLWRRRHFEIANAKRAHYLFPLNLECCQMAYNNHMRYVEIYGISEISDVLSFDFIIIKCWTTSMTYFPIQKI